MSEISAQHSAMATAFANAIMPFIKGAWSAKRGAKETYVRKTDGVSVIKSVYDIIIPNGQLAGVPIIGDVVLVAKSTGEVGLFILTEQFANQVGAQGVTLTVWSGDRLVV